MAAPRLLARCVRGLARGALIGWFHVATLPVSAVAKEMTVCVHGDGERIQKVCLKDVQGAPVYGHAVLGDTPEWDALLVFWGEDASSGSTKRHQVSSYQKDGHVFEDIAPRLADLDGDSVSEIIVVQSSFTQGARLLVLSVDNGLRILAATPYIGTRNRWLAPAGIGDLDQDGFVELSYVDRPHLAKRLRVWRFDGSGLIHVADQEGLTNHRIGEAFITGGLRGCAGRPEIITADATWSRVVATTLKEERLQSRDLGRYSRKAIQRALACQ